MTDLIALAQELRLRAAEERSNTAMTGGDLRGRCNAELMERAAAALEQRIGGT